MLRRAPSPVSNRNQLAFDWAAAEFGKQYEPPHETSNNSPEGPTREIPGTEIRLDSYTAFRHVLVLSWDFHTSFPQPLASAIHAGTICDSDSTPENLKALHDEHTREAFMLLHDLDAILEARRTYIDPKTGKTPRTRKQSEALQKLFTQEPLRLERQFKDHMAEYGNVFGEQAAESFEQAIRAWYCGSEVIVETCPLSAPLPEAVQRAVFGHEEDGTIVNPDEEEVREITESVAEELCDMGAPELRRPIVEKYVRDFGGAAAENLERWAAGKIAAEDADYSYEPGEPWHYYSQGDGARPVPVQDIPPAPHPAGIFSPPRLPKSPARRQAMLAQMLTDQECQLQTDKERYTQLVEHGADVLSEYDREIAHAGNSELAWASAVALKYRQIAFGLARVAAIRKLLSPSSAT
jgi:hypothetical protein